MRFISRLLEAIAPEIETDDELIFKKSREIEKLRDNIKGYEKELDAIYDIFNRDYYKIKSLELEIKLIKGISPEEETEKKPGEKTIKRQEKIIEKEQETIILNPNVDEKEDFDTSYLFEEDEDFVFEAQEGSKSWRDANKDTQ